MPSAYPRLHPTHAHIHKTRPPYLHAHAGDLGGMRLAAAKLAAALKPLALGMSQTSVEPAWLEAERRLGQLAVDADAAATVPLEEDGVAYEDPKPKVGTSAGAIVWVG